MPPGAASAQTALSGVSRLVTFRHLLDVGAASRAEIVRATGMSAATVRSALLELEDLGYVHVDADGPRNGRTVRYSPNRATFTDDLAALLAWTLR
jgi:DNA-binding transcriptional ArsR family regulator